MPYSVGTGGTGASGSPAFDRWHDLGRCRIRRGGRRVLGPRVAVPVSEGAGSGTVVVPACRGPARVARALDAGRGRCAVAGGRRPRSGYTERMPRLRAGGAYGSRHPCRTQAFGSSLLGSPEGFPCQDRYFGTSVLRYFGTSVPNPHADRYLPSRDVRAVIRDPRRRCACRDVRAAMRTPRAAMRAPGCARRDVRAARCELGAAIRDPGSATAPRRRGRSSFSPNSSATSPLRHITTSPHHHFATLLLNPQPQSTTRIRPRTAPARGTAARSPSTSGVVGRPMRRESVPPRVREHAATDRGVDPVRRSPQSRRRARPLQRRHVLGVVRDAYSTWRPTISPRRRGELVEVPRDSPPNS